MISMLPTDLRHLYDSVVQVRPALGERLKQFGELRLNEYCGQLEHQQKPSEVLKNILLEHAARLHSPELVESFRWQLERSASLCTSDHCGTLFQPLCFQSNLVTAYAMYCKQLKVVPVLATGNIPMNNKTEPRAIYWGNEKKNIMPSKYKRNLVYGHAGFSRQHYENLPLAVQEIVPFSKLEGMILSDQFCKLNTELWKAFGSYISGFPNLVYLHLEDVVIDLLEYSFAQRDEYFHICCSEEHRSITLKALDGLEYCWSGEARGSQLFWARSGKGRAVRLKVESNKLVGLDSEFPMQAEALLQALRRFDLVPTNFLALTLLIKHGAVLLAGVNQCERMPPLLEHWVTALQTMGFTESSRVFERALPTQLVMPIIALYAQDYSIHQALESMMCEPQKTFRRVQDSLKKQTLRQNLLSFMFPFCYHEEVPTDLQREDVLKLDTPSVARKMGI
ncbi:MAG: hypothetical protein IPJ88_02180 [Myxococcales bacterium]|nr:MAG: hypothetical protein IPJ88_02180 [Myxococcales bacterium]